MELIKTIIERMVMLPVQVRHWWRGRAKRKALADAIAITQRSLAGAKQLNAQDIQVVFNVSLYVLLLDQDLTDFTDALVFANGRRRREFLGEIRKLLAAHRDHDALLYAEALGRVDPLDVMRRAAELSGLLGRLARVLIDLSSLTAGIRTVYQD